MSRDVVSASRTPPMLAEYPAPPVGSSGMAMPDGADSYVACLLSGIAVRSPMAKTVSWLGRRRSAVTATCPLDWRSVASYPAR